MMAETENSTAIPLAPPPAQESPLRPSERASRFTLDGDEALERHLARTCEQVLSGVRGLIPAGKLEAVLLGGGYGRGEGGVLRTGEGDRPYNDLEFYVAITGHRHGNEFRYQRRLQVLGEILTHLAGVEVEFKITSRAELARRPISMFSYDLVVGNRLLSGPDATPALAGCEHHRRAEEIPVDEATRLLMNRCSGLLFARAKLARDPWTPAAADYVRRNIAKARLAVGDAVLAAHGLYHWSCRERHNRLRLLVQSHPVPCSGELVRHHAAGVEFKLHPETGGASRESLQALHAEVTALACECWLRLESRRLGRPFATARDYALDDSDLCPGTARARNLLLALRAGGGAPRFRPHPWRHPRQRIFRSLALLLWEPTVWEDADLRRRLEEQLGLPISSLAQAMGRYEELWARLR